MLDLILELAEQFPELYESETAAQNVDRSAAASIINNHIYGNSNVIASGRNVSQRVRQRFEPSDIEGLANVLEQLGISGKEREDLRSAIKDDGARKEKKLGPRVAAWVGKTTQKLLEAGVTAAPGAIAEALAHYYGWS